MPAELAKKEKRDNLWFADIDGTLIAYAEFANSAGRKGRLDMPTFNGFQSEVRYSDFREGWLVGERQGAMHTIAVLKAAAGVVGLGK